MVNEKIIVEKPEFVPQILSHKTENKTYPLSGLFYLNDFKQKSQRKNELKRKIKGKSTIFDEKNKIIFAKFRKSNELAIEKTCFIKKVADQKNFILKGLKKI